MSGALILHRVVQLIAVLVVAAACAAGRQPGSQRSAASPDRIVRAELEEVEASTSSAYEAVEQLRPRWLHIRGVSSFADPAGDRPVVVIDNVRTGDVNQLRNIAVERIEEIRFVSGTEATTRWGTGVVGGVIEVITRRGGTP